MDWLIKTFPALRPSWDALDDYWKKQAFEYITERNPSIAPATLQPFLRAYEELPPDAHKAIRDRWGGGVMPLPTATTTVLDYDAWLRHEGLRLKVEYDAGTCEVVLQRQGGSMPVTGDGADFLSALVDAYAELLRLEAAP